MFVKTRGLTLSSSTLKVHSPRASSGWIRNEPWPPESDRWRQWISKCSWGFTCFRRGYGEMTLVSDVLNAAVSWDSQQCFIKTHTDRPCTPTQRVFPAWLWLWCLQRTKGVFPLWVQVGSVRDTSGNPFKGTQMTDSGEAWDRAITSRKTIFWLTAVLTPGVVLFMQLFVVYFL